VRRFHGPCATLPCATGGWLHEPQAAGKLTCATTLSLLDTVVVTRRRRRVTSFAFPSGGRANGRVCRQCRKRRWLGSTFIGRSCHCHRYARLAVSVPPRPSALPTLLTLARSPRPPPPTPPTPRRHSRHRHRCYRRHRCCRRGRHRRPIHRAGASRVRAVSGSGSGGLHVHCHAAAPPPRPLLLPPSGPGDNRTRAVSSDESSDEE